MKYLSYIIVFLLIHLLTGCSSDAGASSDSVSALEVNQMDQPVVSQKAFDRGRAAGVRVVSFAPGSREREQALIETHGIVSALQRNGFSQSAADFSKGVYSVLQQN